MKQSKHRFFYKYFFVLGGVRQNFFSSTKKQTFESFSRYLCAVLQFESSKTAANRGFKGKGGARETGATKAAPPPSGAGGGGGQSKGGPLGPGTCHDTPQGGICKDIVRNIDKQFAHTMLG